PPSSIYLPSLHDALPISETSADFILAFRKYGFKVRNLLTIPRGTKGNGGDRIFQQQFEFCIFATLGSKGVGRKFNQTEILKPSRSEEHTSELQSRFDLVC